MKRVIFLFTILLPVNFLFSQTPNLQVSPVGIDCEGDICIGNILGVVNGKFYTLIEIRNKIYVYSLDINGKSLNSSLVSSITGDKKDLEPLNVVTVGSKSYLLFTTSALKKDYTYYASEILAKGFGPLKEMYNFVDYTKIGAWNKKLPVIYTAPKFNSWSNVGSSLSVSPDGKYLLLSSLTIDNDVDKLHLIVFDESLNIVNKQYITSEDKTQFYLASLDIDNDGKIAFAVRVTKQKLDSPKNLEESTFELHVIDGANHLKQSIPYQEDAYYLKGIVTFTGSGGVLYVGTISKLDDRVENATGFYVAQMDNSGAVTVKNNWIDESFFRKLFPNEDPDKKISTGSLHIDMLNVLPNNEFELVVKHEWSYPNGYNAASVSNGFLYLHFAANGSIVKKAAVENKWFSNYKSRQTMCIHMNDGSLAFFTPTLVENPEAESCSSCAAVVYLQPDGNTKTSIVPLPEDTKTVFSNLCYIVNGEFVFFSTAESGANFVRVKP